MIKSKIYKGIEYIQLSALPTAQRDVFVKTFDMELMIKILVNDKIVHDCISYKDYTDWYERIYGVEQLTVPVAEPEDELTLSVPGHA